MVKLNLNESFICRIWEESSYYSNLKTTLDKEIEIVDYGTKNTDSGPDYYNCRVKIGGILYSGCAEIHRSESDWHEHKHSKDNKYNEVILHIVFYKDDFSGDSLNPKAKKSRQIPTVILSEFLTKSIHEIWKEIINNPSPRFRLPCFPKNHEIATSVKTNWLSKLSKDRLNDKSLKIKNRLEEISDDLSKKIYWENVLFEYICEALGYSKNKNQFLNLAQKTDIDKIKKLNLNRIQTDSLLFGLSGFLIDLRYRDKYIDDLKSSWNNLNDIIRKEIADKSEWNFFRLRPANFPTVRIAYASGILFEILYNDFFKGIVKIFEESSDLTNDLIILFKKVEISEYWKRNYNFGKESKNETAKIGEDRIKDIITNVLLPLINLYAEKFSKTPLKNRVDFLYRKEKQKSGSNEITRIMEKQLDVKVKTISDEQALIQLHNLYCLKGKCNDCEIGKVVFSAKRVQEPLKIILY
ncbi:MAG TPA: DUF2851 family protein [Ignavibacteria bacterium]|nr:DUF2851 family protein [Ignavibacteria bacterium]